MKRLYNAVLCVCALLLIGTCVHAYARDGSSCTEAIPMGTSYNARVENGQSVWYSAWTFDLPLTVTFAPDNGASDPAPDVLMDFTCRPGYYADSILCSLFCKTSTGSYQVDMPHTPNLKTDILPDGTFVYYLSLGKTYRDLLLQAGISANLEVFVQVTYNCGGTISLSQDNIFANCMDNARFMHLGDTVHVAASDKQRHVVVPYVQWQNDTIRYKWKGMTPCIVAVANKCDFDPSKSPDGDIIDYQTLMPPVDSMTVSAALLSEYVNNQKDYPNEAGMYFVKFYSEEPGVMKIVKVPQTPPHKNATILRFDRTYALNANDQAAFAIPNSWNDDTLNTKFVTPTEHLFSMTIATYPDFTAEHILKTYQFEKAETGHWQGIFASEMIGFWTKTTEPYLYVRFDCSEATTITPSKWIATGCIEKTKNYIQSKDTTFKVERASNGGFYKFNYSRLVGGKMELSMNPAVKCDIFAATDCDITLGKTVEEAPNLLYYHRLTTSENSVTIPVEEIAAWGERVTSDGYIYMRYHQTQSGTYKMTIHSEAPAEADPDYPKNTIAVACDENKKPFVEVSKAQTIVIKNESGAVVKTIEDLQPETKFSLSELSAGKYTLVGETDEIVVNL